MSATYNLPLSPRVQEGLRLVQAGRFPKKKNRAQTMALGVLSSACLADGKCLPLNCSSDCSLIPQASFWGEDIDNLPVPTSRWRTRLHLLHVCPFSRTTLLPQLPNRSTIAEGGLVQHRLCVGYATHESLSLGPTPAASDPMRRSLGAWPVAGAAQQGHAPGAFGAGDRRVRPPATAICIHIWVRRPDWRTRCLWTALSICLVS